MLFRMGTGTQEVTHYLADGSNFAVPTCMTSLGLSTDEPFSKDILRGKVRVSNRSKNNRIYLFSPKAWEQSSAAQQIEEIQSWRVN